MADLEALLRILSVAELTTTIALRVTLQKLKIRQMLGGEDYQEWRQKTQPFPSSPVDFILYTILRNIPTPSYESFWEKTVRLQVENMFSPRQGLIMLALTSVLQSISDQSSGVELLRASITDKRHDANDAGDKALILSEPIITRFATVWYGCQLERLRNCRNLENSLLISTLLKPHSNREVPSLDFALQRYLLSISYTTFAMNVKDRPDSQYERLKHWRTQRLLDELVSLNTYEWDRGFKHFSQIVESKGLLAELQHDPTEAAVISMEEVQRSSLEFAVRKALPSLLRVEVAKWDNTYTAKELQHNWNEALLHAVNGFSNDPAEEDGSRANVVAIILNHLGPNNKENVKLEIAFRIFCQDRRYDIIKVLVEEQEKWRTKRFSVSVDETIAHLMGGDVDLNSVFSS
ncbi:hypothetical protein H2198_002260 [Neophaeococcomyces mojaviensis]|uniref:Uncharacterized protein n=1 Tax=Neophaeococcomyces mojaviensis TaxID=3383035 RepID=A0ACC3AEN9_9EURO|nr:hypothetical protein H2198_002260 [Knufia sp. JES_112]